MALIVLDIITFDNITYQFECARIYMRKHKGLNYKSQKSISKRIKKIKNPTLKLSNETIEATKAITTSKNNESTDDLKTCGKAIYTKLKNARQPQVFSRANKSSSLLVPPSQPKSEERVGVKENKKNYKPSFHFKNSNICLPVLKITEFEPMIPTPSKEGCKIYRDISLPDLKDRQNVDLNSRSDYRHEKKSEKQEIRSSKSSSRDSKL